MRKYDFETLKSSSSNFDKPTHFETNLNPGYQSNKNKYQDDRFCKPELDKINVMAMLLLDFYLLGQWRLAFTKSMPTTLSKDSGDIENSLTTLNQKDPVSEENTRLQNTVLIVIKRSLEKEKESYLTILIFIVVSDPKHPENEVKCSYSNSVKRYLIRLLVQCNLLLKNNQLIHLIFKVQTLN